jgi:hypothetical protein
MSQNKWSNAFILAQINRVLQELEKYESLSVEFMRRDQILFAEVCELRRTIHSLYTSSYANVPTQLDTATQAVATPGGPGDSIYPGVLPLTRVAEARGVEASTEPGL